MATVRIQKYIGKTHIGTGEKRKTSYSIRFKDPVTGATKYYKTFQKKRDAQQSANDLRLLIDSGEIHKIGTKKAKREFLTFNEVTESLVEQWRDKLECKELAPITFEGYQGMAEALCRIFGKKMIYEISPEVISRYHRNRLRDLSAISANRHLFILKQICKHAKGLGAILEDPAADIHYFNEDGHMRNKFIGPPIIDKLVKSCGRTKAKFYMPAVIYLGAEHGACKQEVLSLNWADIDFEFEDIGLIRLFRTKNTKERTEYLMPRTKQALLAWRDHQKWMRHRRRIKTWKSDRVFCHLDGSTKAGFFSAWQRIVKLARLKDFHFHDLRHTFCSNLLLSGSELKDVKEMIGHRDITMTDRYAHLTMKHKRGRQIELAKYYASGKNK